MKSWSNSAAYLRISAVARPSSAVRFRTRSRTRGGDDHSPTIRSGGPLLSSSASNNGLPPVSSCSRETTALSGGNAHSSQQFVDVACVERREREVVDATHPFERGGHPCELGEVRSKGARRLPMTNTRFGIDNEAS